MLRTGAGFLAEPVWSAACIGNRLEAFNHLTQARCIAGRKNDGLK